MAKKARKKLEEEAPPFEFPEFDEKAFLVHEFEMTTATFIALSLAVLIGIASWAIDVALLPWFLPILLGLFVLIVSPFVIGRLAPTATQYTNGDWAGLIALQFFLWLALWFVLLNVSPHAL